MKKANNLRRTYMVYTIIISELFVAAFIICAGYIPQIGGLLRILGYVAAGVVPIGIYLFSPGNILWRLQCTLFRTLYCRIS